MYLNIIDKYIAKTVLKATFLVILVLIGLQIFMLFVNQLDEIGKGNFGILECMAYVVLQMPYQVYLFLPMASLLGCLIGLGLLANNHELVVMRSAGYSIGRVSLAVLKGTMFFILLVTLIGETISPKLVEYAANMKDKAILSDSFSFQKGSWIRIENDYINIGNIISNTKLENVNQFHFDNKRNLVFARLMRKLEFKDGKWIATDVKESDFNTDSVSTKNSKSKLWEMKLNPEIFTQAVLEPEEMTLTQLHHFLHSHKKIQRTYLNYTICYWQRLILPLTTAVMMILAIPFIFGPLRSSTMGYKLLAGASMGFGFYILNRVFGTMSQVLQWPGLVAAIAPTLFFAVLGLYIMQRSR